MNRLIYFLIALILAFLGQRWLTDGSGLPRDALILMIVGGIVFAIASFAPLAWPPLPPRRKWAYGGIALAGVALLMGLAATGLQFWRGNYDGWGLWLWLAAIPIFFIGTLWDLASPDPEAEREASSSWLDQGVDRRLVIGLLLVIIVIAAAVRFYALDTYPNGCQSDECNNGLDALKWLAGASYRPYAETNEGQATLFTYLIAMAIQVAGQSVLSMRMVSAAIGTLTVISMYFLVREVQGQRIGLLVAALVAADRWHITFSRIVYELIMMPLVLSLQAFFLIKALKSGRRRWWALSGMMLALGMNTYTAYRVVPFFFALYFLYWLVTHRARLKRDLEGMVVFAAGAALTVAPLGVYTIKNWNVFISRINHISVWRDVEAAASYEPLWSNLRKTLYMFNWQGDNAALNNLPGSPLLHGVIGVLLVLGILWAIRWFYRELPFFYLVWFVAVASVAVLSVAHEAPTARRPIGLIPVIYLLVGSVFAQIWSGWTKAWGEKRWRPLMVGLSAIVIFVMISNINTYFRVQATDPSVWAAYSPNESAVGRYLASVPPGQRIYMTPQYTHHSAVSFIGGKHNVTPLNLAQHIPLRDDPGADVQFILEPVDERLVPLLQQLYPDGAYEVHRDRYGRSLFLSYRIARETFDAARGLQAIYTPTGDEPMPPLLQQVNGLEADFTTEPPLPPPFRATYEGALLVPAFGTYQLELTSEGGEAVLAIDDTEILRVEDGVELVERTLAGGFHGLQLVYNSSPEPEAVRVRWSTPIDATLKDIDLSSLYTLPGASNGLVGYYYNSPDWSGMPTLIQRDLFILPNNILREPFSIRWVGKIAAPVGGMYMFGTRSDDGSLVYVNDQLVVDNSGSHGAEYREGVIQLEEGFHDIEVLYNELGGSREMQLWWRPPGSSNSIVPSAYLFPVEDDLPQDLVLPPIPAPATVEEPVTIPQAGELPPPDAPPSVPAAAVDLGDFPVVIPAVAWTYGTCGDGEGELLRPIGVTVDGDGDIYVADMGNYRIVHLDSDGNFVSAWGSVGEGPGQFQELFDLVVAPSGDIAALDAVNQVISRWSPEGDFIQNVAGDLAMYRPRGLGIGPDGDFYVADTGGVRVLQIRPSGVLAQQFGGPDQALGPGQPTDVAVSMDGALIVTEPISGLLWWVEPLSGQQQAYTGPEANTIESPHLAVMDNGRILLTDPEGARVLVYGSSLDPVAQFGSRGGEDGQFSRPVGIAVTEDARVLVTDPDLCRVTMFEPLP